MTDSEVRNEWWAKDIKEFPDLSDDECEMAFDIAWVRGMFFVTGGGLRMRVTRYRPTPGPFEKAIEPVTDIATFLSILAKGVVERSDNHETSGEFGGTYYCTRAFERYAYFLYRDGGARPWELYRKNL